MSLVASDLSVRYGRRVIIPALTLTPLPPGTVTALVGPNAAGKSTLLRAIAGLVPSTGHTMLNGVDLGRASMVERARLVAFLPQALPVGVSLSVLEGVVASLRATPAFENLGSRRETEERALATLERFGILALALEPISKLSGGQRQLASLAQAAVREPALLLLDEPTSALDPRHQLRVMTTVRRIAVERQAVVLVVLHDLSLAAQFADRIVVLSGGSVHAEGTPEETMTEGMLLDVYRVAGRVERCSHGRLQVMIDAEAGSPERRDP
jgi:iron complex transport system ATP-binding protein